MHPLAAPSAGMGLGAKTPAKCRLAPNRETNWSRIRGSVVRKFSNFDRVSSINM